MSQSSFRLLPPSLIVAGLLATSAMQAAITGVSGDMASNGGAAEQIAAPSDVLDDCVNSRNVVGQVVMQGFDEAQDVTLGSNIILDGAVVVPAGTMVSSHMIFFNSGFPSSFTSHDNVTWTFDENVIGVMTLPDGVREANSSGQLGAPGTNYSVVSATPAATPCGTNDMVGDAGGNDTSTPGDKVAPFQERGIEAGQGVGPQGFIHNDCPNAMNADGYTISGSQLTVCMRVTEPGDWIRVITESTVSPPPSDGCEEGKPSVLEFEYTGKSCAASQDLNSQTVDTCAGTLNGETGPLSIEYTDKFGSKLTLSPTTVVLGGKFTLETTGRRTLHSNTAFDIKQGETLLQSVRIHTSCSQPLVVGEEFGGLKMTGYTAAAPKGKK